MAPEPAVESSRRVLLYGAAIIFAVVVLIATLGSGSKVAENSAEQDEMSAAPVEIPAYTPEVATRLANSNGFQALASYTDRGFEPAVLSISKGETIRFTNNSQDDMWIVPKEDVYLTTTDGCKEGDPNSWKAIAPLDFWEFTFESSGEWTVHNKLVPAHALVVTVE